MTKSEILQELPKLTPDDLREIRAKLNELEGISDDDELSEADKRLIEKRIADYEKHPKDSIPWDVAKAELKKRFGA